MADFKSILKETISIIVTLLWITGLVIVILYSITMLISSRTNEREALALCLMATGVAKLYMYRRPTNPMARRDKIILSCFMIYVVACALSVFFLKGPQRECLASGGPPEKIIAACNKFLLQRNLQGATQVAAFEARSTAYEKLDQPSKALADLNSALDLRPDESNLLVKRGVFYITNNQIDLALADFNQALTVQPNNLAAVVMRTAIFVIQKKYNKAMMDANQAIQLDPQNAAGFVGRGLVRSSMRDYQGAIGDFNIGYSLTTTNTKAAIVLSSRAVAYICLDMADKADTDLREALQLDPANGQAILLRASEEVEHGDFAAAIADLDTIIQQTPKDGNRIALRGIAKFYGGNPADAARDFLASSRYTETDDEKITRIIWLHLARLRAGQEDKQEFDQNSQQDFADTWPLPLLQLYRGNTNTEDVFTKANTGSDLNRLDQNCEAGFYVGEYQLIGGKKDAARKSFDMAIKNCSKADFEYDAAQTELKAMGNAAPL